MTTPAPAPLVSVIIPAYRVTEFVADAVRSALSQTYENREVILINDGTPDTDAFEAAIAPFRGQIAYIVQENLGLSAARNRAIRSARGEFIALLDADDMWLPIFLEDQVKRAAADPSADVFYGDSEIFGDVSQSGQRWMKSLPSRGVVTYSSLVMQQCNVMICALVRRSLFDRVGFFDESLRSSEDFDLWLRAAHAGSRFNYTRRVLSRYRKRASSLSSDPAWMCRSIVIVLDKCLARMALSDAERRLTSMQRALFAALQQFHEGKRAFFLGDIATARAALTEANRTMRSSKLRIVLFALRMAPGFVLRLYDLRDRIMFSGARTKY